MGPKTKTTSAPGTGKEKEKEKATGSGSGTAAIDLEAPVKTEVCRDEEDEQENAKPQTRVTRSRARKSTTTNTRERDDAVSGSTRGKQQQHEEMHADAGENEAEQRSRKKEAYLSNTSPRLIKIEPRLSPFQDLTNKISQASNGGSPAKTTTRKLPSPSPAPPANGENANEVSMAEAADLLQNLHVSDGVQDTSEPPPAPTSSPVANEEPKLPAQKLRFGTVVVWGKLYEELCGVGLARPDVREDVPETGGEANHNSDAEQSHSAQVDGEGRTDRSDLRKRPYNKRNRAKRDPELMTKSEHMRILRSAIRNTMQCKMRDVLGMGEGPIEEPSDEISEAIRGVTTRKRRGRKSKASAPSTNEGEDANATSSSSLQDENGEIPQDLDDDSTKPRTTYHELIKIALEENPEGMTVSAIYNWMSNRHPSFQMDDTRWKNSVRHNLSINPYFEKHTQLKSKGGGHIWKISEKFANCSQSRPPPMKRAKSVGRPRRQDEDTDALRREFNKVMQDAGLGGVKQELAAFGMEEDPLMLTQDLNNMQLFTIEGFGDQAGEPCFDANGNFAPFGDAPFPVEGQYGNFMLQPISVQGVPGEYYVVNQPVGDINVDSMNNLNLQDSTFGYLPMDHTPIASFDVSQLASGVHNIDLIDYQPHRDEQSGVLQPDASDNLLTHSSDEGAYIHTGEKSYSHTGEESRMQTAEAENEDTSSAD